MPRRYGYESRKKCTDGVWLKPKHHIEWVFMQPSSEQEKVQRLSREGVHYKLLVVDMGSS